MDSMAHFLYQEQYLAIFRCLNASGHETMLKSDWNYLQEVLNDVLRTARRWAKCGNSEWFGIFWDSVFLTGEVEQSIKECLYLGGCRGLPGKCLLDPNPGRMWGSNLGTTAAQRLNSKALVRRCLHPYPSLRHNP